ncbi:DUF3237 domain-containing protein [Cryptosporangium sp. NPDC048952]|uniref:DUF3237 domain-containing protein n=1 Tax=Cryptosporangium sp. NPDC048952 TaxID=3363961 RepID=UPI003718B8FF
MIAPTLKFFVRLRVDVGEPIDLGAAPAGHRRLVPVLGGTFDGPQLRGRVLPGGADDQRLVSDTLTELDARYALETDDGARIGVRNVGIRVGAAADIAAIIRGEPVPAERIYFRTQPRFSTADAGLAWLNERLFVARGFREPSAVSLEVYLVE